MGGLQELLRRKSAKMYKSNGNRYKVVFEDSISNAALFFTILGNVGIGWRLDFEISACNLCMKILQYRV